MITLAYGLLQAPYFEDAIQNTEFKDSITGKNILSQTYNTVSNLAFMYKSEEHIKSGAALDEIQIDDRKSNLKNEQENAIQQVEDNYFDSINQYQNSLNDQKIIIDQNGNVSDSTDIINDIKIKDIQERIKLLKAQKDSNIKEINDKYDKLINDVKNDYINQQLSDYKVQMDYLKNYEGIHYTVVENDKTTFTNVSGNSGIENYYKSLPYSVQLTNKNINEFLGTYHYAYSIPENTTVHLGVSHERYNSEVATFEKNSSKGLAGIKTSAIGLLSFLTGFIYLLYAAGRRSDKDGVHLIAVDIIYLDIALAVSIAAIALCFAPIMEFLPYYYRDKISFNASLVYAIFSVIIALGTLIGLLFMTMFAKRLKRHEVIRHTLIFRILNWIFLKIKKMYYGFKSRINYVFDRSPLAMRLVLIFGAYALLIFICSLLFLADEAGVLLGFIGIVGVNVVAVYFVLKTLKTFTEIRDGAERIRAGELTYNLPEQGLPELKQLSVSINKIADGLKNAVGSQVKAERMKAELITNVSHDLKTPLTSIITYVDLLKNEGLQSENAEKYLGIIDSKSQRLKSLTEDLFEAAKATSGNIAVNFENINVASLITQGLGELSDKIEASELNFKTNLPTENILVNADGRLLWRVIENLLSNVFKYALPNSRVYIDVIPANDETVKIIIKNISAYELNVDADELMERFKRGDASRHSEGSGLGLSIAKSLTELQGGSFSINIDGDLFKATITLPMVKE
jgi:signal transduction histidine kinase